MWNCKVLKEEAGENSCRPGLKLDFTSSPCAKLTVSWDATDLLQVGWILSSLDRYSQHKEVS